MSYSLVNMPVLGFDLCRMTHGPRLADVVLTALQLDGAGLGRLTTPPGTEVPAAPGPCPDAHDLLGPTLQRLHEIVDAPGAASVVGVLERSMLGDFAALVRLIRDDVLDWTWHGEGAVRVQRPDAVEAVDVLIAAAAELYDDDGQPGAHTQAALAHAPADTQMDLGPLDAYVRSLLRRIAGMRGDDLAVLRARVRHDRSPAEWATAVHDASWGVYLSGRLRPAAAAQLLAVKAFRAAGCTPSDGAYGLWNAISGAIQAAVVADAISSETRQTLLAPCAHLLP